MAAVSVTRLTQHAPIFRLELLLFSCSPTPPGTSPVGGLPTFTHPVANGQAAPIAAVRRTTSEPQGLDPPEKFRATGAKLVDGPALAQANSTTRPFTSFRSAVSKPSLNQP
jgi:hypothetical protein